MAPRGYQQLHRPDIWAPNVGLLGGAIFVTSSSPKLPEPWPVLAMAVGAIALAAAIWAIFIRRRELAPIEPAGRTAGLVYLASVALMIALIYCGTRLLDGLGHSSAAPAWVATSVGLHFVPFAWAFTTPFFRLLGWALAAIGAVGVLLVVAAGLPLAGPAAAVVAGITMIVLIAIDALGDERRARAAAAVAAAPSPNG